jgi:hypothetical protein
MFASFLRLSPPSLRWPEDLPPNSCIVLSGNDDLCHAEQVQKMVAAAGTAKVGASLVLLSV